MDNNLKHLHTVYDNMHQHLGDDGYISRVTRALREAARKSAEDLGLNNLQHGMLMIEIARLHKGKTKEKALKEIKRIATEHNNINK